MKYGIEKMIDEATGSEYDQLTFWEEEHESDDIRPWNQGKGS